jgi:multidrug resistance efflux pump
VRLRSWRGTIPVATSARRRIPWARIVLVLVVVGLLAYVFVPSYFYLTADALVEGDLVPVTTLFVARIDRLYVRCDSHVVAGEKIADVSNFIVQAGYQQQYLQSQSDLTLSQIAVNEGIDAARSDAEAAKATYEEYSTQARRLGEVFAGYDRAYKADAIGRVEWEAKNEDWKSELLLAESARQAWIRALQHVHRVESDSHTRVASAQQAVERAQGLTQRLASEPLRTPTGGYVVECNQRPENVVNPGDPILSIFDPNRAYILAYVSTASVGDVRVGQEPEVIVPGVSVPLKGRISAIYPTLTQLPDQLTRFFWQHVQWTEYRPVRIELNAFPRDVRAVLGYGTQVRIRMRIRP